VVPVALTVLLCFVSVSRSQSYRWQGFMLHEEGVYRSHAEAIDIDVACGDMDGDGAIWPGTTSDYVSLRPDGVSRAFLLAADDGVQGGYIFWSLQDLPPTLWRSTAESFVDLVPGPPYQRAGQVLSVSGDQLVGYGQIGGLPRAMRWSAENPADYVDLHPSWADWSDAWATDGVWQGGRVASTAHGGLQIGIWKGTAESWTRLAGPGIHGNIFGMAPGVQVGYVVDGSSRATLWRGTPESAVRLHLPGGSTSRLKATTGDMHVGYADAPGESSHARLWFSDDPEDNLDLHQFVPPRYGATGSAANDISVVDGVIYIAGIVGGPRAKAFLWVGRPVDEADQAPPRKRPDVIGPRRP
jgi:hypothetical protein